MPWAKGEANKQAKLTEEQVLAIRRDTRTLKEVAYEYSVSPAQVWRIRNRIKWAYLEEKHHENDGNF